MTADRPTDAVSASRPASVRSRVLAYLVDLVLVGGAILAAAWTGRSPVRGPMAAVRRAVAAATLYHVVFEGFTGRTAGKVVAGIAVVREDGSPCTLRAATVRTLGRFLDWLPVGYLLGFLSVAVTDRRQRVGDLLAGTVVVRSREER